MTWEDIKKHRQTLFQILTLIIALYGVYRSSIPERAVISVIFEGTDVDPGVDLWNITLTGIITNEGSRTVRIISLTVLKPYEQYESINVNFKIDYPYWDQDKSRVLEKTQSEPFIITIDNIEKPSDDKSLGLMFHVVYDDGIRESSYI